MPAPESDRFSYVRIAREVVPTPELEKFRARIETIGRDLGEKDSTTVRESASLDEQLKDDYEPRLRPIGIAALDVYKSDALRSTLFEVRRARSQRGNSYLKRLSDRLMKLDLETIGGPAEDVPPVASGSYLLETTTPVHFKKKVREFGIVLANGPTHERLMRETTALYRHAATRARRLEPEQVTDPSVIAVLTVPLRIDDELLRNFIDEVNERAFDPAVHVTFEPPQHIFNRR